MTLNPDISPNLRGLANNVRPAMDLPPINQSDDQIGNSMRGNAVIMSKERMNFAQSRHRIGPLFASTYAYWHNLGFSMTDHVKKQCDDVMHKNVVRFMQQKLLWAQISKHLKAAGIEFWGLKGQNIAETFYPNPANRWAKDIDVMIAPKDALRAAQILIDNDIMQSNDAGNTLLLRNKIKMKISKDINMRHRQYPAPIELHQRLLYCEPRGFSELVRQANAPGEFISAHSETGMFYTIIHGALAYWSRLKWIVDLSFIGRHIDQQRLLSLCNLADQFDCRHALIASLYWGNMLFPNSLNDDVLAKVQNEYVNDPKAQTLLYNFSIMLNNDYDRATRKYWKRPDFPTASWHIFNSNMLRARLTIYVPVAFAARQL